MDNFRIDITSEGRGNLLLALQIVFGEYRKAVAWKESEDKGLVFYWTKTEGVNVLAFAMKAESVVDLVIGWLETQDYGKEPDHDGDNGKGWRLYNESWGRIGDEWQAFIAIKPTWAMYGK